MFRRSIRLIVATVMVAGTMAVFAPAATSAIYPCQGRHLFSVIEYQQTVAVAGAFTTSGAVDVQLTCGIVQGGVTVKRFSESVPGPVAALGGTATVAAAPFTMCYELAVTYLDRPPYVIDQCP